MCFDLIRFLLFIVIVGGIGNTIPGWYGWMVEQCLSVSRRREATQHPGHTATLLGARGSPIYQIKEGAD